jgi:hypothetical protein
MRNRFMGGHLLKWINGHAHPKAPPAEQLQSCFTAPRLICWRSVSAMTRSPHSLLPAQAWSAAACMNGCSQVFQGVLAHVGSSSSTPCSVSWWDLCRLWGQKGCILACRRGTHHAPGQQSCPPPGGGTSSLYIPAQFR